MAKKRRKTLLKRWIRVLLMLGVLTILLISLTSIVEIISMRKNRREPLYSYEYNGDFDYKVYLKENEYFKESYLKSGREYLSRLVDHVDSEVNYQYKTENIVNYTYSYEIAAIIEATGKNSDKVIWSKKYPLKVENDKENTGKDIKINDKVTVDYKAYKEQIQQFQKEFGTNVDGSVNLELTVSINNSYDGSNIKDIHKMSLNIPLLKDSFVITEHALESKTETAYKYLGPSSKMDWVRLVIYSVLFGASTGLLVKLFDEFVFAAQRNEYEDTRNSILKEFKDVVVEAKVLPDLQLYDVIEITNFNDMLDVQAEVHSPIIYVEQVKNKQSVFLILHNNMAYKYVLKDKNYIETEQFIPNLFDEE